MTYHNVTSLAEDQHPETSKKQKQQQQKTTTTKPVVLVLFHEKEMHPLNLETNAVNKLLMRIAGYVFHFLLKLDNTVCHDYCKYPLEDLVGS